MKKITTNLLISGILLLIPNIGFTQRKAQYWKEDLTTLDYDLAVLIPESVIDTVNYTIYYWQKYRMNPDKKDIMHDRWGLDIGKRYSRFYSVSSYRNDLNYTKHNRNDSTIHVLLNQLNEELTRVPRLPVSITTILPYEILCDYNNNKLVLTDRIPAPQNGFIYCEEDIPKTNWTIQQDESKYIGGFKCYRATTEFRGREWNAWFTPEITINVCLWKLSGLPGLILKLVDATGDFSLEMIQICKKSLPLWQYKLNKTRMSFEKLQRLVKGFHENASTTLLGNECELLRKDELGNFIPVEEWIVPYNPIERE